MATYKITRRDMLKLTGTAAMGTLLAACAAPVAPVQTSGAAANQSAAAGKAATGRAAAQAAGTITVMANKGELSEDQIKQFEKDNPGIKIEFVEADFTRFMAMYAAGNPPDIYRTQGPIVPSLLARNLLLDLTDKFQTSKVIKVDDLQEANKYYWAESPTKVGSGKIYGMVKDFSPDFTLFAYTKAFEDAKTPVPDPSKAMTYAEVADLAAKLAQIQGDRIQMFGYGYADSWIDRIWMNCLAESGKSLYSPNFEEILLTADDATALVKYYVELAQKRLVASPLDPSPKGWSGADFTAGLVGLTQWGYWFQAMAETDVTKDKVVMLVAPTWTGQRRDPTMTATGWVITADTKAPDAAWSVFEWYMAGQPAIDRAKSGWGVPAQKSMVKLLPQDTAFQKETFKILNEELALNTPPLQFNPYLGENVVSNAFNKYLDQYLRKQVTFDDLIKGFTTEVNQAIKDGMNTTSK